MDAALSDKKFFFLVNSHAGGGSAEAWWEQTRKGLDMRGYLYSWEFSRLGEIEAQARAAVLEAGAEVVVVVGGDGTLFHVLNGLMEGDKSLRPDLLLVCTPVGSGCDFARTVYGEDDGDFFRLLAEGRPQPLDVGRCLYQDAQGRQECGYFLNSFDAGAGADTCANVNQGGGGIKRLLSGKLAFLLSALSVLISFRYTHTQVEYDGGSEEGEYIIMGVGNGRYIGGGMKMFPEASLSDGKLDMLLVRRRSFFRVLLAFGRVYTGRINGLSQITACRSSHVRLRSQRPLAIELDGEVPGVTDADITVLPGAIQLLALA